MESASFLHGSSLSLAIVAQPSALCSLTSLTMPRKKTQTAEPKPPVTQDHVYDFFFRQPGATQGFAVCYQLTTLITIRGYLLHLPLAQRQCDSRVAASVAPQE